MFLSLPFKDIMACQLVNKSSKELLANPIFWIRKWGLKGLSKKNQDDWINAIRLTKNNSKLTEIIVSYIKKVLHNDRFIDIPCYIDEKIVEKILKFPVENAMKGRFLNYKNSFFILHEMDAGSFQISIGWMNMKIPKYVMERLQTSFAKSAGDGGKDIFQVLAPFIGNANETVYDMSQYLSLIHI